MRQTRWNGVFVVLMAGLTACSADKPAESPRPALVVVGEPTDMVAVSGHKGISSFVVTVTGKEAHSSQTHLGASAIIMVHNHPSGDPHPSADDVALTARLVEAGHVVGIDVLDHLVLADQRYYSFMEAGQLPSADR